LRSMLHGTYRDIGFREHSVEKAEIRCSQCSRLMSSGLCSFVRTAIRMLSSSQATDALSLISNQIWRALVPSGARPMTKDLARYRQLELRLWMARWKHEGQESAEEDAILDEMDDTWMRLTDDEQALLRLEGPKCWPTESTSLPPQLADTLYVSAPTPWAYEGFHSPAEAILSAEAA
jgi:hypothetical protein